MKTKFSELVKLKKQKLSEIERALAHQRFEKQQLLSQISDIIVRIQNFTLPKSGDVSSFQMANAQKNYLFKEKEQKENMIKYFDQEIERLNILYKEANIEYEKVKHLHQLEEQKMIDARLREEAKQMDEIAGQLFFLQKQKDDF
jgi:flagellar biosynthesis chaperone FliJ